jgi:tetratricopeptide (TPR) repeat protein
MKKLMAFGYSLITKKMKKLTILSLFVILSLSKGVAQTYADKKFYLVDSLNLESVSKQDLNYIDSSLTVFHASENDSVRFSILNDIVDNIWDIKIWPQYNDYLLRELEKTEKNKSFRKISIKYFKKMLASAYNNLGYYHNENGRIKDCLTYYTKALKIRTEINDEEGIGGSLMNIGVIYKYQKSYDLALDNYNKALEIFKKLNNETMIGYLLNNIGSIYKEKEQYSLAKQMFFESLVLHEKTGDLRGLMIDNSNLGGVFAKENNLEKALEYLIYRFICCLKKLV